MQSKLSTTRAQGKFGIMRNIEIHALFFEADDGKFRYEYRFQSPEASWAPDRRISRAVMKYTVGSVWRHTCIVTLVHVVWVVREMPLVQNYHPCLFQPSGFFSA